MAALHLATRGFLAGKRISDEQRNKEQERARENRRIFFEKFKRRNPREKPRKEKEGKFQ